MEVGQVQLIIAWVSIIGTTLGSLFAACTFLHREMREGFRRQDKRMDAWDAEIKELRTDVKELRTDFTHLMVGVARIEGHLGIGFRTGDQERESNERPDCAA